jgi:hypothetical protein
VGVVFILVLRLGVEEIQVSSFYKARWTGIPIQKVVAGFLLLLNTEWLWEYVLK